MEHAATEFNVIREIADVSLDGLVIYNIAQKKLIYANTPAFELLGLQAHSSRLEIEALLEKVIPQDREYLKTQYEAVMEKTSSAEIEFQLANQLGKPIVLCCNAYLVFDKSAIIVFIKDITKSKEHEDYIVKYGARKNTVLDSLAHQVSGAINLMQHLASQAEKYVEATNDRNLQIYLDLLNNNSSHCLRIIYDVLKEEHQVSPGVAVRNSRIDIVEKMAIIHESLQQSYRTRKFVFFSPVKSLHINTDEVKVLQVVNNLTSNAIKFSHSTSTITLSIAMKDHMIIVSVTDEGIGIPDSMKPAIFENQFGIGRTGLNGERSIGLGLSICKDLVRLLGGDIWFDNTENKGSTFYVGLPGN